MRLELRRKVVRACMASVILTAVVAGIIIAVSRRASVVRADCVALVVAEIRQGNYFAWIQAREWWDRLSEPERTAMRAACKEYAQTNRALHWRDVRWPPQSRGFSIVDGGLEYQRNGCLPAFYQVPVDFVFEGLSW